MIERLQGVSAPDNRPIRPQYSHRPGDRVVRRAVLETETVSLRPPRPHKRSINPALALILGFAGLILLGTIILMLPFASTQDGSVGFTAALFTSTSAVCVTGLVVIDTGTGWTGFGQAVILVLIQLGGFGFMTSATLLLLFLLGHRTSLQQRLLLGQTMGGGLPGQVIKIIKRIAIFTLALEAIGATILFPRMLREMEVGEALWWSIFHSVSAFNNAGFDLVGDFQSLIPYQHDVLIISTIGTLAVIGAVGYTVVADTVGTRGIWRRMSVDTRLVLSASAAFLVIGFVFILVTEVPNPNTLGDRGWGSRVLDGVFYSMTPRTAGFTAIPMDEVNDETAFFTMATMFIGGGSGSTAGGIKIQTFMLLFFAILAAARNREQVVAFGREMPISLVFRALTVALVSIALLFTSAIALTFFEPFSFLQILFETTSAYGTVGLSLGITPELSEVSRMIVTVTMFIGRLGPLALVLALAGSATPRATRYAQESVKIG
ncbi:MAG: Trk family potassium uptake protein [Sphaerobacteraceae bacterium]|nr:MAG: Trk family potassium uptake protein [Sphaerobacteraceae bacterium]